MEHVEQATAAPGEKRAVECAHAVLVRKAGVQYFCRKCGRVFSAVAQ